MRPLLLAGAALWLGLAAHARAEEPAAEKAILAPEVEKKYAELLKKLSELRQKDFESRMQSEQEAIAEAVHLTAEQKTGLQEAAAQATATAVKEWTGQVDEMFRKSLPAQGKQAAKMIGEASAMAEAYVKENFITQYTPPTEEAAWAEGLHRVLTAEQAAAWEKLTAEKKKLLEDQVAEFIKPLEERLRATSNAPYLNKAAEIRRTLRLDQERGDKLEALARTMADAPVAEWRKTALRQLMELSPEERQTRLKSRRIGLSTSEVTLPDQQKAWEKGMAGILTKEEIGRLSATKTERHARAVRAMGQVMVQVLDDRIAFTTHQREQLQPIAERLVRDVKALFRDEANRGYFTVSTQLFFAAGAKATDAELKPILDASQLTHWRAFCVAGHVNEDGEAIEEEPAEKPKVEKTALPPDPDDFENVVSDFLYRKSVAMRRSSIALALLRAEEAGRVCDLPPEAEAQLQTAARGAAEATLSEWRRDCEQNVRSNLEGSTGQSVRQRLAGMEDYYFMRLSGTPETQPVWVETLKSVVAALTPAQQAALQRETRERTEFHTATIVRSVLADFDAQYLLSTEQYGKVEGLIAAMLKEYGSEIGSNFSNFEGSPWYLQPYYKFIPIAGIPEKELKETLTKQQYEGWLGSRECSNCSMYWTNIQQNHARRQKK